MRKRVASFSTILIAVTLLAACGGDGGSETQATLPLTTDAPVTDNFATLIANAGKQRYKITYTDQSDMSQAYAQDGKGNSVQIAGDSRIFFTKTATITCDKNAGAYECTESPPVAANEGNPLLGVLTLAQAQLSALGGNVGARSEKTIAGRDAQCITFAAKDLAGDQEEIPEALLKSKATYSYCIDNTTGVTLEVSGTNESGEHTTSLEVSNFESPSASDFVPPAPTT